MVVLSDVLGFVYAIGAIVLIGFLGFVAGKILHKVFLFIGKKVSSKTETRLDDMILESIEGPFEAASTLVVVYFLSGFFESLDAVHLVMARYAFAGLILLSAYVVSEVIGAFLQWYYVEGKEKSQFKIDVTLLPVIRKITKLVIMFVGVTWSLAVVGFDVTGLLTLASVSALVLGLASQETLANIFAGIALQIDRQYAYGDYLKFSTGEVARLKKIGVRSARLEDLGGSTIVISNSEFAKQRITNLSRPTQEFKATLTFEIPYSDVLAFEKFISNAILSSKVDGLKSVASSLTVERVAKDFALVGVNFWVSNYSSFEACKNFVNRKALEFKKNSKK